MGSKFVPLKSRDWMEISYFLYKQKSKTNKGHFSPNLAIAWRKNAKIVDDKFTCPNDLTLFTTISCNSRKK